MLSAFPLPASLFSFSFSLASKVRPVAFAVLISQWRYRPVRVGSAVLALAVNLDNPERGISKPAR